MLAAHEPYPAVVVDRVWNVLQGNRAMGVLMAASRRISWNRSRTCSG
ncbi:hypothetical protein [Nonomuraea sp. NPDC049758]